MKRILFFISILSLCIFPTFVKALNPPEAPIITASDGIASGNWHNKPFKLIFSGYDAQSGYHYSYSNYGGSWHDESSLTIDANESIVYYVRACLNSTTTLNCTNMAMYNVLLDTTVPKTPTITASDGIASGEWHKNAFSLTASGSGEAPSKITYYYGVTQTDVSSTTPPTISNETTGTMYYAKACTGAGLCSEVSSYLVKIGEEETTPTPSPSEPTTPGEKDTSTEEIENPQTGNFVPYIIIIAGVTLATGVFIISHKNSKIYKI